MAVETDLENLDGLLDDLEGSLVGTQVATLAFQQELEGMKVSVAGAGAEARAQGRNIERLPDKVYF